MNRFTSIKTRITIWYTALMFVLITVVLALVGILSYQLSIDNIEKAIKLQVTEIAQKVGGRHSKDIFHTVNSNEEFKSVSIYLDTGEYVVGQYNHDLSSVRFKEQLRHETVDGEEYIVYDVFRPARPGDNRGYWIRGAESVNYAKVLGSSMILIVLSVTPLILLLTALGGYYITKKAFHPINNIIKTANEISEQNDVTRRIEIDADSKQDELQNLSVTLNQMLDKIDYLIKQEKQFTADASHELRTPISVILAQGEYLLDIADTDKEKELAQTIVDKANQISKLVSHLLLLARIDQNRQKLDSKKVDLQMLVDVAIENVSEAAERKDIQIISDVPENTIIDVDETLFLSVMTNLISNAVKYGKESGHVMINALKAKEYTEITVLDNGIGIDRDNLNKIWERFYRVDDVRNDEYGSNGLGLSMAKSIIELHGGKITVESRSDQGTEFKIVLPIE